MAVDLTAAAAVSPELRHRPGLSYPNPLAGNPGAPQFAASVRRSDGTTLQVSDPVATRLMVALMDMNAVIGGAACHWGGPAALAELMSSIHGVLFTATPWHRRYNFVNDAGHTENGLYALKASYGFAGVTLQDLKGFRSISSKLTGHGESHLFPAGVMVSNGPLGSSLPIAQGLALADTLANHQRTTVCVISDGAMMEGEAKEAVAALPGFAGKGLLSPFVLVISDNNTKLSGRIDADAFSMEPTFAALAALGWTVVPCEHGNDLQSAFSAVESAIATAEKDPHHPVVVWAKTVKGYSVASTVKSPSGGHGFPLSGGDVGNGKLRAFVAEINGGKPLPAPFEAWLKELEDAAAAKAAKAAAKAAAAPTVTAAPPAAKKDKIQGGFPKAMISAAERGLPVVSVSADLQGSTGVAPFRAKFPQLSFEVGVAEANMISTAAGFSKQGYIPVVDTFVQFGTTKGLLPLTMAVLSQSAVLAVFTHTGFQDAADGASHQGLYYLAATGAVPHTLQYCPASAEEAEWALGFAIQRFADQRKAGHHPESVLFFCGRENFAISLKPAEARYVWGEAMTVADTTQGLANSVVISANGSLVAHAIAAAQALKAAGIGALVLNNATPNRPDLKAHAAALARCGGRLVTVEDHQAIGGAGAMLVAALAAADQAPKRVRILGVKGEFGQSSYTADELYDKHGLGIAGITSAAKALL
jgi:transketolase